MGKLPTIAAFAYRVRIGRPFNYPDSSLGYAGNFLYMLDYMNQPHYEVNPVLARALDVLFILHADHEQNCSTAAVRLVGSAKVNLYAAISAGISALWGPLHGGANQAVVEMLGAIEANGGEIEPFIARAKDKNDPFRLMGFGHRVYKTYDPRARIMKNMCDRVLSKMERRDPLLDIARRLEEVALGDPYFIDHALYPNVDFYSGIVLRAMGIPSNMFTVMFAIGRLPGWISQWKESMDDLNWKLGRPRQVYTGPTLKEFTPVDER